MEHRPGHTQTDGTQPTPTTSERLRGAMRSLVGLRTQASQASENPALMRELEAFREVALIDVISLGLLPGNIPGFKISFGLDDPNASVLKITIAKSEGGMETFNLERRKPFRTPEHEALVARASFRAGLKFQS